jgi:hypothetical protein
MQDFLKKSIIVTALISIDAAIAFVPSNVGLSSGWLKTSHQTQPLYSSLGDDELSKLIGKRSQIKRQNKEELPSDNDKMESLENDIMESLGSDPDALDLDKMPDFQTKRKARATKKPKEDKKAKAETNESTFNDFFADYVSSISLVAITYPYEYI